MRKLKCVIAGSRSVGLKEVNGNWVQMTLEECPFVMEAFTKCEWSDKILEIVSGTARGVDNLGEQLAMNLNLNLCKFPADWSLGRGAGHIRNRDMAKYTDIAIILWDGYSKGSKNMISEMKKLGKPCIVFIVREGELFES